MSYLIDTPVLLELVRPSPDLNVLNWIEGTPDEALYVSVLSLGEIRNTIANIDDDLLRERVRLWLKHDLPDWFGDRMVSIDSKVANHWGKLQTDVVGKRVSAINSLLAATALTHNLHLVTRNQDFFVFGKLDVINPWLLEKNGAASLHASVTESAE